MVSCGCAMLKVALNAGTALNAGDAPIICYSESRFSYSVAMNFFWPISRLMFES